jgi:hypothetical protein
VNPPLATRVALVSVVALGAAAAAALAPWDAGASAPVSPRSGSHAGSIAAAATNPAPSAAPVTAVPSSSWVEPSALPAPTPELAGAPLVTAGEVQIPIIYHSQQDPDWCDPADIEMWLQADGVSLPVGDEHAIQQQFWTYETDNNDGYTIAQWNASPYAVASTLDHYGGWSDIGDQPQPTADAAGLVISYSLDVLHQPVIVMVGAGTHYVLVTGAELGPAGAAAPPLAVTVDDPLAYGVGASPPAGTDGTEVLGWGDFTDWYTANTNHGGVWAGQWVIIAAGIPLVG